ncbi:MULTISPECIES: tripartite tricarboxylate transporter TctB family protein [unclassified Paracoccus (in: a-proteobacteria)]|uniref:tripartite tricarboxylate transporter TctB family protein n=1 Tax=unclassified Paracoccus (in: a-proteobacteria) TaxID=2688777 RepID=UPI0012B3C7C4|nr:MULTISPECIES: tripartite tricarboxylate transporter TctB family protein [unclassified Paracoccus (in: a-proteobacteria)]UXU76461.1 tripartite tricarboxylate transporter TctB family protein [Paracoccus sp. SMMA_5]UXU82201.1 tripartite tricarboxylate transporter TctB family protein [Paracoccus sp. SMMA_5_TC]
MTTRPKDRTDLTAGLLLMATAGFFGWQTMDLEIGSSLRMGPGYFPMMLSILLFALGALIALKSLGREDEPIGPIAWRGILLILPAPIFFGLTVRGLGFVPALFLATLIAAQASRRMRPLPALILAILVTILSTLIFSYGLGLPFRRFGPWLGV